MQTLRRERIQKFTDILKKEDQGYHSTTWCMRVAELLADAAESRTERKTGEYVTTIETAIQAGVPVTEEMLDKLKVQSAAIMAFESAFGITSTSWAGKWHGGKPEWTRLRKWVIETWKERPTCFEEYIAFKKGGGKYLGLMDVTQIARNPENFYTSWDVFMRDAGKVEQSASPKTSIGV
jgi:hypothetical protein